jgi:hypothetical protein
MMGCAPSFSANVPGFPHEAPPTAACGAFIKEKPHEPRRHQYQQKIRGSGVERSPVPPQLFHPNKLPGFVQDFLGAQGQAAGYGDELVAGPDALFPEAQLEDAADSGHE